MNDALREEFYAAWWWLNDNHQWAIHNISMVPMKVHPKLKRVVNDKAKNTLVNYWLETGPWENLEESGRVYSHDIRLDCGADTFEEAMINLADLVKNNYGQKSDPETGEKIQADQQLPVQ